MMNPVDEWIELLGLRRDADLARVAGKKKWRVPHWRASGISPDVVLELFLYARARNIDPPERLLRSYKRRKSYERRLPSEIAA